MKKYHTFNVSLVLLATAIFATAQGRNPLPTTTPIDPRLQQAEDINNRSRALQNTENHPVELPKNNLKEYEAITEPLYRNTTESELKAISPNAEIIDKYASFLKQDGAGIIKLVADIGCAKDPLTLNAAPECAAYTMPGAGSSYSFRKKDYRLKSIADLNFRRNMLEAYGTLILGILVDLGDVPIETVDLNASAAKYLLQFKPVKRIEEAGKFANELDKGIRANGLEYRNALPVRHDATYMLRSVAYQGDIPRRVKEYRLNEAEFDNRRDVIVVFRIVELVPGKSLTLVWKKLADKKADKIK